MDSTTHLPNKLPIFEYKRKILESIDKNRVLVISGKTGCGKSTQVPKYIHQKWPKSIIAICEPRRLAATSLAIRVAQQLNCKIGTTVGYQIGMESKISQKSQIIYMTYGILIQQLLFQTQIEYTHIILDQVHQRSLQMDFTFIALKKILDSQSKRQTKVIIMSATINSSQFAKYFSTNINTNEFLKPLIKYKQQQRRRGGRNRNRQQTSNIQLNVDIQFQTQGYRQAESIILPDTSLYKVTEYFADQIKGNRIIPEYSLNDDVRIKQNTYDLALKLIDDHLKQDCGDILIFVPGMFEIKTLKQMLIQSAKAVPQQIIEVHSAYSQQLYQKLFRNPIKNKVILATNIGQSSITLPFCKTVVDFCLTRKSITIKLKGYSRFQTRVASKANLMQRSGRVGRISDGVVYRLIQKQLYQKLDDFDIPQIQCVSLDMVILRAKQIDQTYNSTLFEDPYEVIFNAIQPPKFEEIHEAIQYLIKQQALKLKQNKSKGQVNKFTGEDLKITPVGQFMVTMPCNIRISKMVLTSIHYGIASTMVDIAAILLTQKPFFQHQQKRENIQEFMHSMIGYDKGDYNDFLLRQRMFSHWRKMFFEPFQYKDRHSKRFKEKEKMNQTSITKAQNGSQIQKILQQFNNLKISGDEWYWCGQRGISPWVMRDILRISENIRQRLKKAEKRVQKSKQNVDNQLVILCLCIAFQDTTCQLEWKTKNAYRYGTDIQNYVSLIQSQETTKKNIYEFMAPQDPPQITEQVGGFIRIRGNLQTMSKLLLPRMYTKASLQNTTALFKYLASNPAKSSYTYEPATVKQRVREVTILNDSINKVCIRPNHNQDYMLISDKIFDSKGKYYMGACALVQKKQLILIKMITAKKVLLQPHVSYEFYIKVTINSDTFQLPFNIKNQDIEIIKQLRQINQQDSSKKLQQGMVIQNSKRNKLSKLLYQIQLKPKIQQWTYIYNQDVQKYKITEQKPINIQQAFPLKQIKPEQSYFRRYKQWKRQYHIDLYLNFRFFTVRKASIICSKCWYSDYLTVIQDLESFCTKKKILKLNQYRGSWVPDRDNLCCSRKHKIGHIINDDEGNVQYQNILMYCPMRKIAKFDGEEDSIKQIFSKVQEGLYQIDEQKNKLYQFQCKICSYHDQYQTLKRVIFQRQTDSQTFWKKITEHMYSKKHLENLQKFLIDI